MITEIIPAKPNTTKTFPANYTIIPGMIDIHVHGAAGADVMDSSTESLTKISNALIKEGVTGWLATTMTDDVGKIEQALAVTADYILNHNKTGAKILGINLEGPFLSPTKTGAQAKDKLLNPDIKLFKHWQKVSHNLIKVVTIAPELPDALELIEYLKSQNIIISLGHSNADYQTATSAITAGATQATHLFNAMPQIHQRKPGLVTAALLDNNVYCELIADNIHLHPAILDLTVRLKTPEKIILISDAMRAKGLPDGPYTLGPQQVKVKAGRATLYDGTLAGSTLRLDQALRNLLSATKLPLERLVPTVTTNPAKQLGLFDQLGSITTGKPANLTVLDQNNMAKAVFNCSSI